MQSRMDNLMTCQTTPPPQQHTIGVWPARFVGLAIALLAAVPVGLAHQRYRANQDYLARAVRVEAAVIDMDISGPPEDRRYVPIYRFRDTRGTEWTVRSPVSYSRPPAVIGQAVSLFYDPQDPEAIKRPSIATFWAYISALGVFALVLIGLGGWISLKGHRIIRTRPQ